MSLRLNFDYNVIVRYDVEHPIADTGRGLGLASDDLRVEVSILERLSDGLESVRTNELVVDHLLETVQEINEVLWLSH